MYNMMTIYYMIQKEAVKKINPKNSKIKEKFFFPLSSFFPS